MKNKEDSLWLGCNLSVARHRFIARFVSPTLKGVAPLALLLILAKRASAHFNKLLTFLGFVFVLGVTALSYMGGYIDGFYYGRRWGCQ